MPFGSDQDSHQFPFILGEDKVKGIHWDRVLASDDTISTSSWAVTGAGSCAIQAAGISGLYTFARFKPATTGLIRIQNTIRAASSTEDFVGVIVLHVSQADGSV